MTFHRSIQAEATFNIKKDLSKNHLVSFQRLIVFLKLSVPPQEKIHSHERMSDLGALHGQPGQSDARTAEQDFAKDVQTLLCLQVSSISLEYQDIQFLPFRLAL